MKKNDDLENLHHLIFDSDEASEIVRRYDMAVSGEFGAFEIWGADGNIEGYRGFRKDHGTTTEIYESYRDAIESAFDEFGDSQ